MRLWYSHCSRFKVQQGKPAKVFGAIIGKQKGRNIEVMNSFELDVQEYQGQMIVDRDYYNDKESQFKQVRKYFQTQNILDGGKKGLFRRK